jgi:hypothetical protein
MPRIPNYVWLAMVILTIAALSYTAYDRGRTIEYEAQASYNRTSSQVENARNANNQIREKTTRIRRTPAVAEQYAQDKLRLVRSNEVVVTLR